MPRYLSRIVIVVGIGISGCVSSGPAIVLPTATPAVSVRATTAATLQAPAATVLPSVTPTARDTPTATPTATDTATTPFATALPTAPAAAPAVGPSPSPATLLGAGCDPAYPDFCIPSAPPDLDCKDVTGRRFTVLPPDPHRFDADKNGVGCEKD